MNVKKTLFIALFFIFSVSVVAVSRYKDEPTQQASDLVKQYALADDAAKSIVLQDFDKLARENPENANVIRSYTSLLSSKGEYAKALAYLEPVNRANTDPSLLLQECMLKDRIGKKDKACYQRVIVDSESKHLENMDYLMALYFTDDPKFPAQKQRLQQENPTLSRDFALFDQDKHSLLMSLYP